MARWTTLLATLVITAIVGIGCSGSGSPMMPPADQHLTAVPNPARQTNTRLWGYYDVYLDIENETVEAVPVRSTMFAANVVTFLNMNPTNLQISFNGTSRWSGYVDVDLDVTINHPLGNERFDGYDVRGVFIGDGSSTMQYNGDLVYPVPGSDQMLLNADGYTRWFNPTEFGNPGIFGYTQGIYASSEYAGTATLNPYKYFGEGLDATDGLWDYMTSGDPQAGNFLHATGNTRNYLIRFPIPLPGMRYGYTVVANWEGGPPEFHPAFTPEAVACSVIDNSDVYYNDPTDNGGNLILDISLFGWDYQPSTIQIESTVLSAVMNFDPATIATGGGDHYSTYHVEIVADNVSGFEDQEFWVIAEYDEYDYSNDFGVPNEAGSDRLAAFFRHDLAINSTSGWALRWFSEYGAVAGGVATDTLGNVYITGHFTQMISFDSVSDVHISMGGGDVYLAKFDSSGGFKWAKSWGWQYDDGGYGVSVNSYGDVYVTGVFEGTVDFNPDGGNPLTSNGDTDVFLSKFDSSGNFIWTRAWGGSNNDWGFGVSADDYGNVYVTGRFMGAVDLNPAGGDPHSTNGGSDVFLSKFDSFGNFEWGMTWGGSILDCAYGVAASDFGQVHVVGVYQDTVDFDPGGGDPHTSNGYYDVFLSRFDSSGNLDWARTWGGSYGDYGWGVAVNGPGDVYVTGSFGDTVDFDPDGGDPHTPFGEHDAFLSKFNSSGDFEWARTWGGSHETEGLGVAANDSGNVYVGGSYLGITDFNPGGGDPHSSAIGSVDAFVSKFDSYGGFEWVRTWGGNHWTQESPRETAEAVAADRYGNVYVTGIWQDEVDFAPSGPPCYEEPDTTGLIGNDDDCVYLSRFLPDGCW